MSKYIYGIESKHIDVSDIVMSKLISNNILHLAAGNKNFNDLFSDPCPSIMKYFKISINGRQIIIQENDESEYNIDTLTGLYVMREDDYVKRLEEKVKCTYGSSNKTIDVTRLILDNFLDDDKLKFAIGPKYFNTILTDPDPGQVKTLRIFINDIEHCIIESEYKQVIIDIYDKKTDYDEDKLITFIIPTIGRKSLIQTLESLEKLSLNKWKAIILFDNVEPLPEIKLKLDSNKLFTYIILPYKLGKRRNNAGLIRNIGIHMVTTEWVGFVDDDDSLIPNYIERFEKELGNYPEVDCIIFRMLFQTFVIPNYELKMFEKENVGISFCFRTDLRYNFNFVSGNHEDYDFLDRLKHANKKIVLSNYTTYRVQNTPVPLYISQWENLTKRGLINFESLK